MVKCYIVAESISENVRVCFLRRSRRKRAYGFAAEVIRFFGEANKLFKGRRNSYKIASVCAAGVQDEHLDHIISDISRALTESGYKVLLYNAFTDFYNDSPYAKGEASIYHLVNFDITDVLIIFPETIKNRWITDALVRYAHQNRCPVITVNGETDGCTNIVFDYKGSFREIVKHVVCEHGCKRINFIAGLKNNRFSDERLDAFREVMAENGLTVDEDRIGYGDFWSEPTKRVMEEMFDSGRELPEAVICANDSMAITAVRYICERGYKVPEDIIVTGFDAVYQEHRLWLTHITSTILDADQLAECVAKTADRLLEQGPSAETIALKFRLLLSQSCGCVPEEDEQLTEEQFLKISDYNFASQAHENTMIDYYAAAVNDENFDKLTETLLRYTERFSWLCLNDDFLTEKCGVIPKAYHSVYTSEMTALQHRSESEPGRVVTFKTKDVLPDFEKQIDMFDRFAFIPLHYQSQVLGYYCMALGMRDYEFHNARRFVNITNQVLENFKHSFDLKRAYSDLEMLHYRDPLTGIFNRRGFIKATEEMIARNRGRRAFVFSADMDKLKEINDKHGHTNGDVAIKETADAMASVCSDDIICARFGGDEFIMVGFSDDPEREGVRTVEKIQDHLDKFNKTSGRPYSVTVSVGMSFDKVESIDDVKELIKRSDWKMYEQKEQKRGAASIRPVTPDENEKRLNAYALRIHEILRQDLSTTYFYIDYIHFKWHISENEKTPKSMISTAVNPLRAILHSGALNKDDEGVYAEFMDRIKQSFESRMDSDRLSVHIRLSEDGEETWYTINVWLTGNDGRMSEIAGFIHKASSAEVMQIDILNYYSTTDNPLMINKLIMEKINASEDGKMALIHFDIKRFKFINEAYGEDAGTELLYYISRRLKTYCSKKQLSARLNSDLFMLLTPYEDIDSLTDMIRDIEQRLMGFRDIRYEFAFGVYLIDDKTVPPRVMGDRASQARRMVKSSAIENIFFYDNKMLQIGKARKFIEDNMISALENEEFFIYLQPKFCISTRRVLGFEALVRWKHPARGIIQPGEFIPLFEENGFIIKLDIYVWECACRVLRDWIDKGLTPLPISINVSRAHLKDDSFIRALDEMMIKYRLPKYLLEVEITESIENINTNRMMQEIKKHGYTLLMDDFGSGYSSLNTLKSTNFDVLKIDREFLSSFMISEHGKKIISHTISMSKDIGLGLIAEGVETAEQADFLSRCGCDTAQGFLYARPMPIEDAEKYLETTKTT